MSSARRALLDGEWPTGQSGVDSDRLVRGEHGPPGKLVPDRQGKSEVDVLTTLDPMVDAVIVRTAEDPVEGTEAQVRVRMFEGDDGGVADEQRRRHGAVGDEHDAGYQRDEVGHVDQWVRAKDRQHAHVLLRMMQLVESPHHPDLVVRQVRRPVARVHHDEDHRDREPTREEPVVRQDDPRQRSPGHFGEGQRERDDERHDERRVQHRVQQVLSIPAGEETRRCAGRRRSTTRNNTRIATVAGPTTMTR